MQQLADTLRPAGSSGEVEVITWLRRPAASVWRKVDRLIKEYCYREKKSIAMGKFRIFTNYISV